MASYDLAASAEANQERGGELWVKVGGKMFRVPKSRQGDAAAFALDLSARFKVAKRKGGSPRPLTLEVSEGDRGMIVNLDRVEHMDEELKAEFGRVAEDVELADDLSKYIARSAQTFLGIDIAPSDILEAWDSEGFIDTDEIDEEEDDDDE